MSYKLFFTTFFALYGAMHFYVFWKARVAFSFGFFAGIPICLFLAIMTLAPWLVRISERAGLESLHAGLTYITYIWMAAILIFFLATAKLRKLSKELNISDKDIRDVLRKP